MYQRIFILLLAGLLLSSCSVSPGLSAVSNSRGYKIVSVENLKNLKDVAEFTLINVHIPFEGNIPDTDAEIPFDDIESYLDLLPDNKDEKIIIYCRSGSMGDVASQTLVNLGYTDVSNLEGGYNAWKAIGLPFEEK